VWGFFAESVSESLETRRAALETHQENYGESRKAASGIPLWPSRDPIEERGGANLYCFNFNSPIDRFDDLGHESRDQKEATRSERNSANQEGRRNNRETDQTRSVIRNMDRNSPSASGELDQRASRRASGVAAGFDAIQEAQNWLSDISGLLNIQALNNQCKEEAKRRKSSEDWKGCDACCVYSYLAPYKSSGNLIRNDIIYLQLGVYEGRCYNGQDKLFEKDAGQALHIPSIISGGEIVYPQIGQKNIKLK
ncbi:hypothetical protein ACFQY0_20370, partial [Haloferula chungangensis]